jgi:hypothetical protein
MKRIVTALVLTGIALAAVAATHAEESMKQAKENSAETYEQLANVIIAARKTEDGLVKGIIMHAHGAANRALQQASSASGGEKRDALERAAGEITNAANEGDKSIQSVRQRLSKAGHTHNTDTETKEDYLWIDSKEKKQLLDLAGRVSKLGENGSADDIKKAQQELGSIMSKALEED